jgi:ankyrin repeat protein
MNGSIHQLFEEKGERSETDQESIHQLFEEKGERSETDQGTESNNQEYIENIFLKACISGDIETVNECLSNGLDPTICRNCPIIYACQQNRIAVVDRLLQDSRVIPSINDNYLIYCAVCNKFFNLVCLLLQYPRVEMSMLTKKMLQTAMRERRDTEFFQDIVT